MEKGFWVSILVAAQRTRLVDSSLKRKQRQLTQNHSDQNPITARQTCKHSKVESCLFWLAAKKDKYGHSFSSFSYIFYNSFRICNLPDTQVSDEGNVNQVLFCRRWCKSNELSYSDQYISFWDVSIYIWKRSKNILPRTFDALCCHIISTFDVPTLVQLHSNPGEPPPPEILWHISPLTWPTCQWSFLQNSQPQSNSRTALSSLFGWLSVPHGYCTYTYHHQTSKGMLEGTFPWVSDEIFYKPRWRVFCPKAPMCIWA